jgi:hypothetical protein
MSYIVVKHIKGNPYLYQVRSERTGNKVRQVFEKYLGRADKVNENFIDKRKVKDNPNQTDDWNILRSLIYARDNGICWICSKFVQIHQYDLRSLNR